MSAIGVGVSSFFSSACVWVSVIGACASFGFSSTLSVGFSSCSFCCSTGSVGFVSGSGSVFSSLIIGVVSMISVL